jgi:DNA-binding response OmpR family regulator
MDISIKGSKSGIDLIKEIKSVSFRSDIPILCLTAHSQIRVRLEAEESGSDLFMTKPVANKLLKEAVQSLLKSKKAGIRTEK